MPALARIALLVTLAAPAMQGATGFPLRVAPNGRHLADADGRPWRIQSEFVWALPTKASARDMDLYLADRRARGFNAFVTMAMMRPGGSYGWPVDNANGDPAFVTADDFSTPNDRFFDHVDMVIDKAAAQDFAVLMFYTYAGYNGGNEGWYEVIAQPQNSPEVCYGFGRYLAQRWRNKSNLILMAGGDYTMPPGETRDRMHEILRGLRDGGCEQIAGSEWSGPDSLGTAQDGFTCGPDPGTADLQLNSFYGLGPNFSGHVFETADRAWSNSPVLPAYLEEAMQGFGKYAPIDSGRAGIRRYQHWSVLAGGIAGTNWGTFEFANHFVDGEWQKQLDDEMAQDQERAFAFYQSIPWWRMRPSGTKAGYAGRNLVVSPNPASDAHIASSLTDDGSTLIVYVPPTGVKPTTFAVDLRSLSGPARARWWNPATGTYIDMTNGQHTIANNLAARAFRTPGDNGSGANDWMLVLEATPAPDKQNHGDTP